MNDDLEPTRENDAQVAEAMGWWWTIVRCKGTAYRELVGPDAPLPHLPVWDGDPAIRPYIAPENTPYIPHYTTDPALVVPMLEKIEADTRRGVTLRVRMIRVDGDRWEPTWVCSAWLSDQRVFASAVVKSAATANLAVAATLLAVWEAKSVWVSEDD